MSAAQLEQASRSAAPQPVQEQSAQPYVDESRRAARVKSFADDYQKITTLGANVICGAVGANGDTLMDLYVNIKTAASTVRVYDEAELVYEYLALPVGWYFFEYGKGKVCKLGRWRVRIDNSGSTGSWAVPGGKFT